MFRRTAFLAALALIMLAFGQTSAQAATSLPPGFALERVATGQAAYDLTGFVPLPTGGAITIGKCGKVTFVPIIGAPRQLAQVAAACVQDIGLIGVALPPDFTNTRQAYVLYSYAAGDGHRYARLSHWKLDSATDPTAMTGEVVVNLGAIPEDALSHGPGTILFAPDGTLYLGLGDEASFSVVDANAHRAQDPASPYGKILHIDTTGRGVPGNPSYDAANPFSWPSRVFALGLRNPFRFTINPASNHLYVGDVGWNSWEEHNVAVPGSNFGWPCYEGVDRTSGYQDTTFCQADYAANTRHDSPLYTYPHSGEGAAAVGGIFTSSDSSYPSSYRGAYFFGDYARGTLSVIRVDADDRLTANVETFGTNIGAPVDFKIDSSSGDVTFADVLSGNLYRITYAPGNRAPVASATIDPSRSDPSRQIVAFDASQSYDLDGDTVTFSWNFGDGSTGTGATTTHQYATGAPVTVSLTVTDGQASGTATLDVRPSNYAPVLTLATPPTDYRFAVDELVDLSASATDTEDGDLSAVVNWQELIMHCPNGGQCHAHPDITGSGSTFSDAFTNHGGDTRMLFTATVTDGAGTTVRRVYTALPDVHTLSVTSPYPVTINGFTTSIHEAVAGEQVSLVAPQTSLSASFAGWSDGVMIPSRTVSMPRANLALTARYTDAIDTKYAAFGGSASVLGSATGNETAIAGGSWHTYQRGAIYWSPATAAHEVHGGIFARYVAVGGPASWGFPTTDESTAPEGRYSEFQRLAIGWTSAYGAHTVANGNLGKYRQLGGPTRYGLPIIDETRTPDGLGSYQHFTPAPSPTGRSIYYYPGLGSHEVHGGIRATWASLGWERSRLGYPITDEYAISGGRRSDFQHGYITWNATTRQTTVHYI